MRGGERRSTIDVSRKEKIHSPAFAAAAATRRSSEGNLLRCMSLVVALRVIALDTVTLRLLDVEQTSRNAMPGKD
jgi:hypothetical protein